MRKKYDNIHKFTQEKQTDLELIKVSIELILPILTLFIHFYRKEYSKSEKRSDWSKK